MLINPEIYMLQILKGKKYGGRLERWSEEVTFWAAPTSVVVGFVYEDARIDRYGNKRSDGSKIETSKIIELNRDEHLLVTNNSFYELGNELIKHEQ